MMDWKAMKCASVFSAYLRYAFLVVVVSLSAAACTYAQDPPTQEASPQENPSQQPASQPKPAGRDYQPLGDDQEGTSDSASTLNPDTTALTGVLVPGLGSSEMRHSYWVPGIQYANQARSSALSQPTVSSWNSTSFVAGNLSLLARWSSSELVVNYSGGGTFSTDKAEGDGYFHQLNLAQVFSWRRWQWAFIDDFGYLPQSQFGFGVGSGLAAPGIGGSLGPSSPGLQPNYQPSQSIFTSVGSRYSNSITTQIVYLVSPRGSITLAGSYGILRFVEPGNIDSNDSIFSAGYNYALSGKDTIGVLYRFVAYRYLGDPQAIQDHTVQLAYGRKVTGRLALQMFAGPELTAFRVHQAGFKDPISVAGGVSLTYALPRTKLSAGYNHGLSGGSGVFAGSTADQIQGGVSRQLSRVWLGNISFGYARNKGLKSSSVISASPAFSSWFAGSSLDRPLGRTASLSIGYTAYLQESNTASCSIGTCGSYVQHQVSASFQWHTRPLVLR
jgi:hypothetical protein